MKRTIKLVIFLIILLSPIKIYAQRGCCSHHGGVSGCSNTGRQICADGTLSPSCGCTPTYIYGCTDVNAINYNPNATQDDSSCKYKKIEQEGIVLEDTPEQVEEIEEYKLETNSEEKPTSLESDLLSTFLALSVVVGGIYAYKKYKI